MYAMMGTLTAKPGRRGELVNVLKHAAGLVEVLPGCRMYIVCEDTADEATAHVIEMWDDKSAHEASLENEDVRALIGNAQQLLAGAPAGHELRVAGGFGIPRS